MGGWRQKMFRQRVSGEMKEEVSGTFSGGREMGGGASFGVELGLGAPVRSGWVVAREEVGLNGGQSHHDLSSDEGHEEGGRRQN